MQAKDSYSYELILSQFFSATLLMLPEKTIS